MASVFAAREAAAVAAGRRCLVPDLDRSWHTQNPIGLWSLGGILQIAITRRPCMNLQNLQSAQKNSHLPFLLGQGKYFRYLGGSGT